MPTDALTEDSIKSRIRDLAEYDVVVEIAPDRGGYTVTVHGPDDLNVIVRYMTPIQTLDMLDALHLVL